MNSWENWKCRCSAISKIMANSRENPPLTDLQQIRLRELEKKMDCDEITEKQKIELTALIQKRENSKDVVLSDTAIGYLVEAYAWETERMCNVTKEMDVEYFERGKKTEPESIELLMEVDKTAYIKNEFRFENEFLSGIPDVMTIEKGYLGHGDYNEYCATVRDIKSCQDYPTFLYKIHKGVDPGNKEQLQGYGDILECEDLAVVFTLPNMPDSIREGYKYRLAQKMDEVTTESPRFLKAWAELERSMIFSHMPAARRVYKIPVHPFTPSEKQAVYERVKRCREWLFNFDTVYKGINK